MVKVQETPTQVEEEIQKVSFSTSICVTVHQQKNASSASGARREGNAIACLFTQATGLGSSLCSALAC